MACYHKIIAHWRIAPQEIAGSGMIELDTEHLGTGPKGRDGMLDVILLEALQMTRIKLRLMEQRQGRNAQSGGGDDKRSGRLILDRLVILTESPCLQPTQFSA